MGKIVASLSDIVVRHLIIQSENPNKIIEQMKKGICEKDMYKVNHIVDRKTAIEFACTINGMNDVILVAGKVMKFQISGDSKIDFDDKKILESFLNKKIEMLYFLFEYLEAQYPLPGAGLFSIFV